MKLKHRERFSVTKIFTGGGFIPFILRRILTSIVLIFGMTFISFSITQLVPGDPVAANLGQSAYSDPEIVAAFEKEFGLDQPVPIQYLRYIQKLSKGDFGISLSSKRPVLTDLKEYFPCNYGDCSSGSILIFNFWIIFRNNFSSNARPASRSIN